jgi:hypothetical protein
MSSERTPGICQICRRIGVKERQMHKLRHSIMRWAGGSDITRNWDSTLKVTGTDMNSA